MGSQGTAELAEASTRLLLSLGCDAQLAGHSSVPFEGWVVYEDMTDFSNVHIALALAPSCLSEAVGVTFITE